ncbi:MAG: hypothetical protein V4720_13745 [Pseudomonadota bacterium]
MEFHYAEPQTEVERVFGGHFHINAVGEVKAGDDVRLRDLIEKAAPPPRTTVYINSTGGNVDAAIEIGRIIRAAWFATTIGTVRFDHSKPAIWTAKRIFDEGVCYSAASLIFLGGRLRFVPKVFKFGVHQFAFKDQVTDVLGHSQKTSARISAYLHEMGIPPEFAVLSSSVSGSEIRLLDEQQLLSLGLVTGGETGVMWSMEAKRGILYVKGERDSVYGHHKMMLCYAKGSGFQFWSVIEAQGREDELTKNQLVEVTLNDESERIDISDRCIRSVSGIYVHVFSRLSVEEARKIALSLSFGVQIRHSPTSQVFLGVAEMRVDQEADIVKTFFDNLSG